MSTENDLEKEAELNEISAYYESGGGEKMSAETGEGNESGAEETIAVKTPGHENSAPKPVPKAETTASSDKKPEDENGGSERKPKKNRLPYIITAAAAALIIAAGFFAGLLFIPVPQSAVIKKTEMLFKTDDDYLAAVKAGKALRDEITGLNADNDRIESAFNDVVEYEKQLDSLKAEAKSLNDELYNVRSELKQAENDRNEAQSELTGLRGQTITLSPGIYTVGVHIPSGTYLVSGNGSLLTAGSDKTLKTNINLDTETPYRCELVDRDTIKLSTEAEFAPEGGE